MIQVFHNEDFISAGFDNEYVPDPNKCHRVAMVDTDNMERAFEYTNHIDKYWWENKEVRWAEKSSRSTSVGDVMCKDGVFYVVASCGYRRLPDDWLVYNPKTDVKLRG